MASGNDRKLYGIEDYIRDRTYQGGVGYTGSMGAYELQKAQTPIAGLGGKSYTRGSAFQRPSVVMSSPKATETKFMNRGGYSGAILTPSQAGQAQDPSFAPSVSEGDDKGTAVELTGPKGLTTHDLRDLDMDAARQAVYDVLNRKFQYKAKESPIYTILQQQYERQAEEAAGQAYASAVANTGGFGSSYATLAGEEARRQVMEGMNDRELELYRAAREEFLSERESAVDWYNQVRQMKADQLEEDELAEVEAARAGGGITTGGSEVYTFVRSLGEDGWTGANEASIRSMLNNVAPSYNWTSEDIEAGITALKNDNDALMADMVAQFELDPTVSGAKELMDLAKATGSEAAYLTQASAGAYKGYTEALADPSAAAETLGISAEDWNTMFGVYSDEDERAIAEKAYVLESAGEARKAGYLSADDYMKLIGNDVSEEIKSLSEGDILKPASEVAKIVITMENYKDAGHMTEDEYNAILDQISEEADLDEFMSIQCAGGNERAVNFAENTFNKIFKTDIDMPRWAKKVIGTVAEISNMTDTYATGAVNGRIMDWLQNSELVGRLVGRIAMREDEWDAWTELIERAEEKAKKGG